MEKRIISLFVIFTLVLSLVGCQATKTANVNTKATKEETTIAETTVAQTTAAEKTVDEEHAADKVIIGTIYSGNSKEEMYSALAIKGEEIVYVGDEEGVNAFTGANTEVTKLDNGEFVMAGFVDAHSHVGTFMAGMEDACNIPDGSTAEENLKLISDFVKEHPDRDYYEAKGWITSAFDEKGPTVELLDKVETNKPIFALSGDGHSAWANSALIKLANITKDTVDPEGGRIERKDDGSARGCFRDAAINMIKAVLPKPTAESRKPGIMKAQEEYVNLGYTTVMEINSNDNFDPKVTAILEGYEQLDQENKLKIYTQGGYLINNTEDALELVDEAKKWKDKTKGGMYELTNVKIFMDGIIESSSAYLMEPYSNDKNNVGKPRWAGEANLERLTNVIIKSNDNGMPVHIHAMGDRAVHDAVSCIEKAYDKIGQKVLDCRNTIVHLALVPEEDFAKMKKLNIVANLNPWCAKDPATFVVKEEIMYLGEERMEKEYPGKKFLDNGVHVAFGTDYGASFVFEPINCYRVLKTRTSADCNPDNILGPDQRLSAKETIAAMTSGGAYQLFREDSFGTLESGKKASLVILSKNLLDIKDEEIKDTKVLRTMSVGSWVK